MNADSRPSVSSRQTEQVSTHMFLGSKLPNKTSMKVHILVAATNCDNQNVSKWLHRAETGVGERANRDRLANPDGHERLKEKARAAGHWYTWKAQVAVALQKVAEMSDAEFRQHYEDGQTPNEIVGLCVRRIGAINVDNDTVVVESDTDTDTDTDTDSEYIGSSIDSDESYNPRADIRLLAQREFGYNSDLNSQYSAVSSDNDSSSDYEGAVAHREY